MRLHHRFPHLRIFPVILINKNPKEELWVFLCLNERIRLSAQAEGITHDVDEFMTVAVVAEITVAVVLEVTVIDDRSAVGKTI